MYLSGWISLKTLKLAVTTKIKTALDKDHKHKSKSSFIDTNVIVIPDIVMQQVCHSKSGLHAKLANECLPPTPKTV